MRLRCPPTTPTFAIIFLVGMPSWSRHEHRWIFVILGRRAHNLVKWIPFHIPYYVTDMHLALSHNRTFSQTCNMSLICSCLNKSLIKYVASDAHTDHMANLMIGKRSHGLLSLLISKVLVRSTSMGLTPYVHTLMIDRCRSLLTSYLNSVIVVKWKSFRRVYLNCPIHDLFSMFRSHVRSSVPSFDLARPLMHKLTWDQSISGTIWTGHLLHILHWPVPQPIPTFSTI